MGGKNDIVLPTYQLNIPKKTLEPTNPWNIWSTHFTNLMLSADHNWLRPGFQRFFIKEHEIKTPPIFIESSGANI